MACAATAPARSAANRAAGPRNEPIQVAIPVDDLPRRGDDLPGVTRLSIHERMLAAYANHKTPPIYGFVNGRPLETYPNDLAALVAWTKAGYPLGNHTYSHPMLGKVTAGDFLADLDQNEALLKELMGDSAAATRAWKVFRYPILFEGTDPAQRAIVRAAIDHRGYRVAEVTIDFFDWAYNAAYVRCMQKADEPAIAALRRSYLDQAAWALDWADAVARDITGRRAKHILLMHAGAFSALMLDEMLTLYETKGVRFISLDDALSDPIFAAELSPTAHQGNFLHQIRKPGTRSPEYPPPPTELLELVCR